MATSPIAAIQQGVPCGKPRPQSVQPAPADGPVACACGNIFKVGANFCNQCGAKRIVAPKTCANPVGHSEESSNKRENGVVPATTTKSTTCLPGAGRAFGTAVAALRKAPSAVEATIKLADVKGYRGDAVGRRDQNSPDADRRRRRAESKSRSGSKRRSTSTNRSNSISGAPLVSPSSKRPGHSPSPPTQRNKKPQFLRMKTKDCWNGRKCRRGECWFRHPDGRDIDEEGAGGGKNMAPQRDVRHRKRSRSATNALTRSRSPLRRTAKTVRNSLDTKRNLSPRSVSPSSARATAPPQRAPRCIRSVCSSASTSRDPSPRKPSEQAGKKSTTLPTTFRSFVLEEFDVNVTAAEAFSEWSAYTQRLAKPSLECLKYTKLFYDMYDPRSTAKLFDLRAQLCQNSAATFLQGCNDGYFSGLSLRAPDTSIVSSNTGASCTISGNMQRPHFAINPDVNTVVLRRVQTTTSVWDVHDAMSNCAGLVGVWWTRPMAQHPGLPRDLFFRFASATDASAAIAALATAPLKCKDAMLVAPSMELKATVVPIDMSGAERQRKDLDLSARVLKRLDELAGVKAEITEAVLGRLDAQSASVSGVEAQLDLQVLYLRRVHHFCFYSATWCSNEWELRDRCGLATLRAQSNATKATTTESPTAGEDIGAPAASLDASSTGGGFAGADKSFGADGTIVRAAVGADLAIPAGEVDESEWAREHEVRIVKFLENASLARPVLPAVDEAVVAAQEEALLQKTTEQVAEAKFRCTVLSCGKFFKGPSYVHKHFRKAHGDLLDKLPARREALEAASAAAFMADTERPLAELLREAIKQEAFQ